MQLLLEVQYSLIIGPLVGHICRPSSISSMVMVDSLFNEGCLGLEAPMERIKIGAGIAIWVVSLKGICSRGMAHYKILQGAAYAESILLPSR